MKSKGLRTNECASWSNLRFNINTSHSSSTTLRKNLHLYENNQSTNELQEQSIFDECVGSGWGHWISNGESNRYEEAFCTSCYQCLFQLESHSSIYLAVPSKGVANTQIPGFQNGPIDRSRSTRPIRNPHIWGGSWKNSMSRDRGTASGNCTEVWPFCADPVKKLLGKTSITLSSLPQILVF